MVEEVEGTWRQQVLQKHRQCSTLCGNTSQKMLAFACCIDVALIHGFFYLYFTVCAASFMAYFTGTCVWCCGIINIVVMPQTCIWEVLFSFLSWDTGHHDRLLWFSSFPPANARMDWATTTSYQVLCNSSHKPMLYTYLLTVSKND
jgi:hypothetical protein